MAQDITKEWLDFLTNIKTTKSTTITVKHKTFDDKPLLNIPVDKLFELYGNLVLAGFTEDEALIIVVGIANNARTEL
ncbi:hypothetical protein EB001_02320 [bacterium]|nr:hypothetical protein [bacterium]